VVSPNPGELREDAFERVGSGARRIRPLEEEPQCVRAVNRRHQIGQEVMHCLAVRHEWGAGSSDTSLVRQRKTDIEATIDNLLDNITSTHRKYVDRRIEKLQGETRDLEQQEEALLEQQGRECQAAELARVALALARDVDQVAACGTVEEKRTLIRAFLRVLEFDPESRTGTAYFYAVPSVNGDTAPDPGAGTRSEPATTDSDAERSERPSDGMSSLRLRDDDARYAQKRTAPRGGGSSLIMVAGARYVARQKTRVMRWICELPFEALGRALDAFSGKDKLRLVPLANPKERY
jgi:hypothetical protein